MAEKSFLNLTCIIQSVETPQVWFTIFHLHNFTTSLVPSCSIYSSCYFLLIKKCQESIFKTHKLVLYTLYRVIHIYRVFSGDTTTIFSALMTEGSWQSRIWPDLTTSPSASASQSGSHQPTNQVVHCQELTNQMIITDQSVKIKLCWQVQCCSVRNDY